MTAPTSELLTWYVEARWTVRRVHCGRAVFVGGAVTRADAVVGAEAVAHAHPGEPVLLCRHDARVAGIITVAADGGERREGLLAPADRGDQRLPAAAA